MYCDPEYFPPSVCLLAEFFRRSENLGGTSYGQWSNEAQFSATGRRNGNKLFW